MSHEAVLLRLFPNCLKKSSWIRENQLIKGNITLLEEAGVAYAADSPTSAGRCANKLPSALWQAAGLMPLLSSNEIWLTMIQMGSIKPKLLILCCMPRETDFPCHILCPSAVLCRRTAETKSQTTAHDGGSSGPACLHHTLEKSQGAWILGSSSATPITRWQWQQKLNHSLA